MHPKGRVHGVELLHAVERLSLEALCRVELGLEGGAQFTALPV
jgi:hypothetical protein